MDVSVSGGPPKDCYNHRAVIYDKKVLHLLWATLLCQVLQWSTIITATVGIGMVICNVYVYASNNVCVYVNFFFTVNVYVCM